MQGAAQRAGGGSMGGMSGSKGQPDDSGVPDSKYIELRHAQTLLPERGLAPPQVYR
jgi:hypothetical protein